MPHDDDRIVDLAERRARRIDLPEEPLIKMMRQFLPWPKPSTTPSRARRRLAMTRSSSCSCNVAVHSFAAVTSCPVPAKTLRKCRAKECRQTCLSLPVDEVCGVAGSSQVAARSARSVADDMVRRVLATYVVPSINLLAVMEDNVFLDR